MTKESPKSSSDGPISGEREIERSISFSGIEFVPIISQGKFPNNIPNIFPNKIRRQYPRVS
ncbi:MAG: hypothetical protein PHD11_09310 [Bacteroidales bacterium]|nr:hypothetical protein [Bacteroidales bacterium]